MRPFWSAYQGRLDVHALQMPNGQRIPLQLILQSRADLLCGNCDLSGRWSGWNVRQYLIAPDGSTRQGSIPEHLMRHIVKLHDADRRDAARRQLKLL